MKNIDWRGLILATLVGILTYAVVKSVYYMGVSRGIRETMKVMDELYEEGESPKNEETPQWRSA